MGTGDPILLRQLAAIRELTGEWNSDGAPPAPAEGSEPDSPPDVSDDNAAV